jgi:putative ABC transport system permease protein
MKHALRQLAKSPGFTAVALLTLALGIGVNTSMFSVLYALLFHTPYTDDSRLVRVYRTAPQSQRWPHSVANYLDHRTQSNSFERVAAISWTTFNLAEAGQPAERIRGQNVSADYFPLLGVEPEIGRTFTAEEDAPGKNGVIVLSHRTWMQRFGGERSAIGRQLRINAEPVTIIGVMPERFDVSHLWGPVEAWRPIAFSDRSRQSRDNNYLAEIARLKPGVTLEQAQAEMTALAARLAAAYPATNAQSSLRLVPLGRSGQDASGEQITWLIGALAGFVLLIACANLANLQFARHAARAREQAIRAALGASRWRLIRCVLTESVLLSLAGGALGLLVALWCNDILRSRFAASGMPGLAIFVDWRALAFTFSAALVTGIAFGALPAWFSSRPDLQDALKAGARGSTASRSQHRLRHALIVGEVALALTLLAGAGFFLRGLDRFLQRDPGWRIDGLVTGYVGLRGKNYTTDDQRRLFTDRLLEKMAALPGVESVAVGSSLPTWGFTSSNNFVVEGQPQPAAGRAPLSSIAAVSPDYFSTIGLRLMRGRLFDVTDLPDKPAPVIINETLARTLFPGEDPIGRRVGDSGPYMANPRVIVGIVSDAGAAGNFGNADSTFQMYRPLAQTPLNSLALAVRSSQAPEIIARDLRRVVTEIDADQPVYEVGPVRAEVARELAGMRLAGYSLAFFALLGVLLAAVGIYGVISGFVVQRTTEIGIRLALGAQLRDILTLVLGTGLRLALLGIVLGLGGAYGVARLLRSIAPGLPPADLGTSAAITIGLLAIATFACWLPARRATRVDPMTALRSE